MEELAVQKKQITDTTKQYIVIKLDNELFGIDIMYIDNIVRMQRITRVPKCQDFYKGVINLRGEIVPVMSLRSRFGLEEEYTEILGNKIVCHNLPIRPGRNLAVIVESAAVNWRQKKMGYNAARELYNRVQNSINRRD